MAQAYSNPKREPDPWALPDIEVWEDHISEVYCRCGVCEVPRSHADALGPSEPFRCPSCERPADSIKHTKRTGWFYWYCFPGCLPDSDCFGPYDSEEAALDAAREDVPDEDYED